MTGNSRYAVIFKRYMCFLLAFLVGGMLFFTACDVESSEDSGVTESTDGADTKPTVDNTTGDGETEPSEEVTVPDGETEPSEEVTVPDGETEPSENVTPDDSGENTPDTGEVIWQAPCEYGRVSSPFTYRYYSTTNNWKGNNGVDMTRPAWASTSKQMMPIYATRAGTVVFAGYDTSKGNYVTIQHDEEYKSQYLHLNSFVVEIGQEVTQGQIIGYMGTSGQSTGIHLHFSIQRYMEYEKTPGNFVLDWHYVNPADYIDLPTSGAEKTEVWRVPCEYSRVASPFGLHTDPFTGKQTGHNGVDLTRPAWAATNNEPVPIYATRSGKVVYAGWDSGGGGNYVSIDHLDGYKSQYLHLDSYVVEEGQQVSAGQLIGYMGNTGMSTGIHLHFSIRMINSLGSYKAVNPADYIDFG